MRKLKCTEEVLSCICLIEEFPEGIFLGDITPHTYLYITKCKEYEIENDANHFAKKK